MLPPFIFTDDWETEESFEPTSLSAASQQKELASEHREEPVTFDLEQPSSNTEQKATTPVSEQNIVASVPLKAAPSASDDEPVDSAPKVESTASVPEEKPVASVPELKPVDSSPKDQSTDSVPEEKPVASVPEVKHVDSAPQSTPSAPSNDNKLSTADTQASNSSSLKKNIGSIPSDNRTSTTSSLSEPVENKQTSTDSKPDTKSSTNILEPVAARSQLASTETQQLTTPEVPLTTSVKHSQQGMCSGM